MHEGKQVWILSGIDRCILRAMSEVQLKDRKWKDGIMEADYIGCDADC